MRRIINSHRLSLATLFSCKLVSSSSPYFCLVVGKTFLVVGKTQNHFVEFCQLNKIQSLLVWNTVGPGIKWIFLGPPPSHTHLSPELELWDAAACLSCGSGCHMVPWEAVFSWSSIQELWARPCAFGSLHTCRFQHCLFLGLRCWWQGAGSGRGPWRGHSLGVYLPLLSLIFSIPGPPIQQGLLSLPGVEGDWVHRCVFFLLVWFTAWTWRPNAPLSGPLETQILVSLNKARLLQVNALLPHLLFLL